MRVLAHLPQGWITIEVPRGAEPLMSTYVIYRAERVTGPPGTDLAWLAAADEHHDSCMAAPSDLAELDISPSAAAGLVGGFERLPVDLRYFLIEGLRTRMRSATDCYFDLGHHTAPFDGGRLLHLVSDSQWVFHWLLYIGDEGQTAVLATQHPTGFDLDQDERSYWEGEAWNYTVVADSFTEFLWRWWMDNEIFYTVVVEGRPLSEAQLKYVHDLGEPEQL